MRDENLWTRKYDWRKYWRGVAYQEFAHSPDPIKRASGFQRVMERILPYFYLNEKICGSSQNFLTETLPDLIPPKEWQRAIKEYEAVGDRDFIAGFDHTLADYPTLLSIGIDGYISKIRSKMDELEVITEDELIPQKKNLLQAMYITLEAFKTFIRKWADEARSLNYLEISETLRYIEGPPPTTFREALQLVWMTHIVFKSEMRSHMAIGRFDQYLFPFYIHAREEEGLGEDEILDLLCHFWVRFEEIKDTQNICIGGVTPDGADATNSLTYLCLEATKRIKSPYTNLSARFHNASPNEYHEACCEVIKTGIGFPAIFNDHVIIPALIGIGIPKEVARDFCMVGCVETMLPGRQPAWSDSRFNLLLAFSKALDQLIKRPKPEQTYEQLFSIFETQLKTDLEMHVQKINAYIAQYPVERFSDPFLSALTRDCIENALDINEGGSQYPRFHGIAGMGSASTADSLAALKKVVFDEQRLPLEKVIKLINSNFAHQEVNRQFLMHGAPKYGNHENMWTLLQLKLWISSPAKY